ADGDVLDRDVAALENRSWSGGGDACSGAVDVDLAWAAGDVARVGGDGRPVDAANPPRPHDVLDRAERGDLPPAGRGATERKRLGRGVDPHEHPGVLESPREVAAVLGRDRRLHPARLEPHVSPDQVERLREAAVELPRIAAPDPANAVG